MANEKRILKGLVIREAGEKSEVYYGMASTKAIDRSGEIVLPSAFKNLGAWLKSNPIMYFDHAWATSITVSETSLPIGRAIEASITDDDMRIGWKFATHPFAAQVRELVDGGFLNALSVGFIPKKWDVNSDGNRVYSDAELLEVSVVGLPANAEALITRGFDEAAIKRMQSIYEELKRGAKLESVPSVSQTGTQEVESGAARKLLIQRITSKAIG